MPGVVYLNGEFLPRERATLSVDDRGFIFGDGIYEVTRVVNGKLFEADRHMRRLFSGLRGISIEPHMVAVFHDPNAKAANEEAARKNFVEYGRRLETMVAEIKHV